MPDPKWSYYSDKANPALRGVNVLDEEDCEACSLHGGWPCGFHEGFRAGYNAAAAERLQRLLDGLDA